MKDSPARFNGVRADTRKALELQDAEMNRDARQLAESLAAQLARMAWQQGKAP